MAFSTRSANIYTERSLIPLVPIPYAYNVYSLNLFFRTHDVIEPRWFAP